jgi:demethylmenaquinone methyltransferase/2-methoxy-6-polyprenyl-1,4-benzoquinol methylase
MPKGADVRRMFDAISPRYDFLNHLLSAGVDRRWRRAAVRRAGIQPGMRVLDICCGTGDLALAFSKAGARVVGSDFVESMVRRARTKGAPSQGLPGPDFMVADSLQLPFAVDTFDRVSVGFGIRNVEDLDAGLREMARVLKRGGRAVILEFTTPPARWMRGAFGFYFHRVLPRIGNTLAGVRTDAYSYLPGSVEAFPDAPSLAERMARAGFERVEYSYLSMGIAAIHVGHKADR